MLVLALTQENRHKNRDLKSLPEWGGCNLCKPPYRPNTCRWTEPLKPSLTMELAMSQRAPGIEIKSFSPSWQILQSTRLAMCHVIRHRAQWSKGRTWHRHTILFPPVHQRTLYWSSGLWQPDKRCSKLCYFMRTSWDMMWTFNSYTCDITMVTKTFHHGYC